MHRGWPGAAVHYLNLRPSALLVQISIFLFLRFPTVAEAQHRPAIAAERAPPSPSSLAAAKSTPPASPQLRCVLLYLVDLLAELDVP